MAIYHPELNINVAEGKVPFEYHSMKWIEENRKQQNSVPHTHNYFNIIWVKNGSGSHFIDLDKFEIANNTVYCISPGQIHLLEANENIDGCVISFTSDFLCHTEENFDLIFNTGLFYTFSHSPVISITPEISADLEDVVQKIKNEYENYFLLRSEVLRGYLKILIIYLTRQFKKLDQDEHHTRNVDLVKKFFATVEKKFKSQKKVSEYAADLAVTPNYLNEVVKHLSGTSTSDHIKHRIILEAKRHAVYSDVSMKEIAHYLGFDDIPHFSKYFKNATGMNFRDFKKSFLDSTLKL